MRQVRVVLGEDFTWDDEDLIEEWMWSLDELN